MPDFPALEVVAVPEGVRSLQAGGRLVLGEHVVIGRAPDCELPLPVAAVARRHCLIERRFGRWWLLDMGSSAGTFHNGSRVTNVELQHLDLIDVPSGPTLRFLERERTSPREPAMEAAIAEAPEDEHRWAVYGDWLLERGAALGERLVSPRPEHHGRWLGALAVPWARGDVEVAWRGGLPSRVVLRRLSRAPAPLLPRTLLGLLAADEHFRFLQHLEVDIESLVSALDWDPLLAEGLQALEAAPWPLLRSIRLGPLTGVQASPRTDARLASLRARLPRLRAVPAFRFREPARLEVLSTPAPVTTAPGPGGLVTLSGRGENLVGKLPDCALMVKAPDGHPASLVAVRFAREAERWWVEDLFARARPYRRLEFAMRVNGHELVDASLRPGDLLELAAGLLVRFLA
jgi:uncharacterized protein (TIGR02996 family)